MVSPIYFKIKGSVILIVHDFELRSDLLIEIVLEKKIQDVSIL